MSKVQRVTLSSDENDHEVTFEVVTNRTGIASLGVTTSNEQVLSLDLLVGENFESLKEFRDTLDDMVRIVGQTRGYISANGVHRKLSDTSPSAYGAEGTPVMLDSNRVDHDGVFRP